MKTKIALITLTAVCVLVGVKAHAKKMEVLSHYCVVQVTSPGVSTVDCTGSAAACSSKSDCTSN